MSKKRVFITHGYQSNTERNWFPWLKEKLIVQYPDVDIVIVNMPTPDHPIRVEWIETMKNTVGEVDEHTFFVAHSLGCITDLYFLSKQPQSFGGLILVAGFAERFTGIPELSEFSSAEIHFDAIILKTKNRVVFGSPEDYIVPFAYTKRMAENLDAKLVEIPESGHFMQEDGYDIFPALLFELEEMMRN